MNTGTIVSSILSGISVLLLTAIAKSIITVRKEFHRFMAEHLWLLATTLWTRDKVVKIMSNLGMPTENPPPNDLPK